MGKKQLIFFGLCLIFARELFPEDKQPWFSWGLLWTGSYTGSYKAAEEEDFSAEELLARGTLLNRGDLRFELPKQFISLRFQVLDRRRIPPDEKYQPVFSPGFGFYYTGGGTVGTYLRSARLLRGVLEEQGLPARIRNIWAKSAPFAENRKPVAVDLKNEVSASREPETSLFLESPVFTIRPIGDVRGFVLTSLDDDFNPAFSGGAEVRWSKTGSFRLDAFYTRRELEARKPSAWFSASPPLPERDSRLWALGTAVNLENVAFAFDGAYSETFAFGRDVYASAGFRIGTKPWRFSFAVDSAGPRFVDRAGAAAGEGFRLAGRLQRQWIRSGLFRTDMLLRSSSLGDGFDRSNFSVYFRPSSPPPREIHFFRFTRASLSLGRDARTPGKTIDSFDISGGFNLGPVRGALSWNIHSRSGVEGNAGLILKPPFFETMESNKITGEIALNPGTLTLRAKLGKTMRPEKDPLLDLSVSASFRPGKAGRIGLKIASPDFPEKWNYAVSYRLQL